MIRHLTLPFLLSTLAFPVSADLVFSENFGVGAGAGIAPVQNFNGYENGTPVSFSSTGACFISNTNPSGGWYTGASGGNNVLFQNFSAILTISGIDTSGYGNLYLSFGGNPGLLDGSQLSVSYSLNGGDPVQVAFSSGTGAGEWSTAALQSSPGSIPATNSLSLTLASTAGLSDIRIDDLAIYGIAAIPEPTAFLFGGLVAGLVGVAVARRRVRWA